MLALRSDSVQGTANINDPSGNAGTSVKLNVKYM